MLSAPAVLIAAACSEAVEPAGAAFGGERIGDLSVMHQLGD